MEKQQREVVLDSFDKQNYITERGSLDWKGKMDINYSSILTKLIQETGRLCDRFASDLFISWKSVDRWINNRTAGEKANERFVFGLRESGVDHKEFCETRLTNANVYGGEYGIYRALYVLEVDFDGENLIMILGKGWSRNKNE